MSNFLQRNWKIEPSISKDRRKFPKLLTLFTVLGCPKPRPNSLLQLPIRLVAIYIALASYDNAPAQMASPRLRMGQILRTVKFILIDVLVLSGSSGRRKLQEWWQLVFRRCNDVSLLGPLPVLCLKQLSLSFNVSIAFLYALCESARLVLFATTPEYSLAAHKVLDISIILHLSRHSQLENITDVGTVSR